MNRVGPPGPVGMCATSTLVAVLLSACSAHGVANDPPSSTSDSSSATAPRVRNEQPRGMGSVCRAIANTVAIRDIPADVRELAFQDRRPQGQLRLRLAAKRLNKLVGHMPNKRFRAAAENMATALDELADSGIEDPSKVAALGSALTVLGKEDATACQLPAR